MSPLENGENLADRYGLPRRVGKRLFSKLLENVIKDYAQFDYDPNKNVRDEIKPIQDFARVNADYVRAVIESIQYDGTVKKHFSIPTLEEWEERQRRIQDLSATVVALEMTGSPDQNSK